MDIIDRKKADITLFPQVLEALNKSIDNLWVIASDIDDQYLSLNDDGSPKVQEVGQKVHDQIYGFIDLLDEYRDHYIGAGLDHENFQKAIKTESNRIIKKEGIEEKPVKVVRRVGGTRKPIE